MAAHTSAEVSSQLRREVSAFLRPGVKWRSDLWRTLEHLRSAEAYIFGGLAADLLLNRGRAAPRDVDIVVRGLSTTALEEIFGHARPRRNKFGGISFRVGSWNFDVWQLEQTWAFRKGLVHGRSIEHLPFTTFLNLEAIAIDLFPQKQVRRVYEAGFSEAWQRRCLDINLEKNPYPVRCVLRTLLTAAKYRCELTPRLTDYVLLHAQHTTPEELHSFQVSHYCHSKFTAEQFASWLGALRHQRRIGGSGACKLPLPTSRQLGLDF